MEAREWMLTAAVILGPLLIAIVVTLWSLKQVRYTRKKAPPKPAPPPERVSTETSGPSEDIAVG